MSNVKKNCLFCTYYECEEIGDSDYGAIFAETPSCSQYHDLDSETEEELPNFNPEDEKECCIFDFWKVLEVDKALTTLYEEDMQAEDMSLTLKKSYSDFLKRYK